MSQSRPLIKIDDIGFEKLSWTSKSRYEYPLLLRVLSIYIPTRLFETNVHSVGERISSRMS